MGWLKRDEENFDDSAAFESDNGSAIKIVLLVIGAIIILVGFAWLGYNQYQNRITEDVNGTSNTTSITNLPQGNKPGEVIINFSTFNASVKTNPQGLYYFTTQDKVTGERCYINGIRKDCRSFTDKVCSEKECQKETLTETLCFVNNERIICPDD